MLDQYLNQARNRLRTLTIVRVIATLMLVVASVSVAGAWYLQIAVPASSEIVLLRVAALILVLVCGVVLVRLLARIDLIGELERRNPAFAGRLDTWWDARRQPTSGNLLGLLEQEVVQLAGHRPPAALVGWRDWALPSVTALLSGLILLVLLSSWAGHWSVSAQRLWLGERLGAGAPQISLTPGSVTIPVGFDVVVEARAGSFSADDMRIHARFEESSLWQDTPMSRLGDGLYGFVFVAVGDRIDYYVSSGAVTSERYTIRVAALPRLLGLQINADYPDWSGLPDSISEDGDIVALSGTRIGVEVSLDETAAAVFLVMDGEARAMSMTDGNHTAEFSVIADGSWHVAVEHDGDLARISDSFQIRLLEDAPPEITYVWPGRDRQATAIEEVALEFSAADDFGVEQLVVNVAVNGDGWQAHSLDVQSGDYLLELENLRTADGRALIPGDVISLYAQADDHSHSTRSELYFIDVRPFDRRYRDSQSSGGGQGGGDQLDIAQRQKEILSATWNLLNKAAGLERDALSREAEVVAILQRKLAEQVQVLIERASARSLDQDPSVAAFVESLNLAMNEMPIAAEHLQRVALEAAVVPEQRALAHLRAAEATVRDMDVSMADSRGRGTMSDSLSELVDLEMDRERNRYETPQSLNPEGREDAEDPAWERLKELAERQQQLARQNARDPADPASRWQQEQLRREVEQLREQLERSRQRSGGTSSASLSDAIEALEQVNESLSQQDAGERTGVQSDQQISEALQRAAQSLRENQLQDTGRRLEQIRQRAESIADTQDAVMERLLEAQERSLAESENGEFSPWQDFSMAGDVTTKATMRDELGALRAELARAVNEFSADPEIVEQLVNAQAVLDDQRIDERLAASADAFEMGRPLYALAHEEIVQRGLAELEERLETAGRLLVSDPSRLGGTDSLSAVASLRQALAAARNGEDVDASAIATVARQAQALADQFESARGQGSELEQRAQADRAGYSRLGLNTDDPELLYRMTQATLDLLEVTLNESARTSVQAQEQRSRQRDSAAVAEYFRRLSDEAEAQ